MPLAIPQAKARLAHETGHHLEDWRLASVPALKIGSMLASKLVANIVDSSGLVCTQICLQGASFSVSSFRPRRKASNSFGMFLFVDFKPPHGLPKTKNNSPLSTHEWAAVNRSCAGLGEQERVATPTDFW